MRTIDARGLLAALACTSVTCAVTLKSGLDTGIQAGLASVGLWVAWETRELRKQNTEQLDLLRYQSRVSTTPYLSIKVVVSSEIEERFQRGLISGIYDEGFTDQINFFIRHEYKSTEPIDYLVLVHNESPALVTDGMVLLYDFRLDRVSLPNNIIGLLPPNDRIHIACERAELTWKHVFGELATEYGDLDFGGTALARRTGASVIGIVAKTIDGRVWLFKRGFQVGQDRIDYGATSVQLLSPGLLSVR